MDSMRQKKISRLIQKDLSEIFQKEIREVAHGAMISVTMVRVSPDLGIAKTYLSIFPPNLTETVLEEVKKNNGKIRLFLSRRVGKQLRVIPELHFYVDDSLDYLENIDRLLKD
jgi:ribosome-binding factor A